LTNTDINNSKFKFSKILLNLDLNTIKSILKKLKSNVNGDIKILRNQLLEIEKMLEEQAKL
jgi:hypothetical protein